MAASESSLQKAVIPCYGYGDNVHAACAASRAKLTEVQEAQRPSVEPSAATAGS